MRSDSPPPPLSVEKNSAKRGDVFIILLAQHSHAALDAASPILVQTVNFATVK